MQAANNRNVRVQIMLPPRSADRLEKLVAETESASAAEVVRNALRLYETVIEADKKGRPIFQQIDGTMTPVLLTGPYAPPTRNSMLVPMGTRAEFDATDRRKLCDGLAYVVLDPPALRDFTDNGAWIERKLVHDPEIDVSAFQDGEMVGDVDSLLVRIDGKVWRTDREQPAAIEPLLSRLTGYFRQMTK
jgi:hypothetical protein